MKRSRVPLFVIAAAACFLAAAIPANAQDRPNVVIMLADNVGYGDIGPYGAGEVRGMPTPRIDQLASEGLRLTQFVVAVSRLPYFASPLAASRAARCSEASL